MQERTDVAKPPTDRTEVTARIAELRGKQLEAFECLGAFEPSPATMDAEAISAVTELSGEELWAFLDRCVKCGLLQKAGERYSVSELVHGVARERLERSEG